MTLNDLAARAERDAADKTNARALMAGGYARHAVEALHHRDWRAANDYLMRAIERLPEVYAPALALVDRCRAGATTSAARAEASRANGRKGGRPRRAEHPILDDIAIIVVPVEDGAIVTRRDQELIVGFAQGRMAHFAVVWCASRDEQDARLAALRRLAPRLSKPMRAVVVTGAQWRRRFLAPETIPGTGVRATRRQLADAVDLAEAPR